MNLSKKEKIFNDVYSRKLTSVKNYCRRYMLQHEAEETAHDIFFRLYNNLDKFREDCSIDTWLYTITMNICKNFYKSNQTNKRRGFVFSLDSNINHITHISHSNSDKFIDIHSEGGMWLKDKKVNIEKDIQITNELDKVKQEIDQLPNKSRNCFLALMEADGFCSCKEAAEKLGVSEQTIRTRLSRARKILHERWSYNEKRRSKIYEMA
jgi:RNA polymerase sigma factor (sigma-70 family)